MKIIHILEQVDNYYPITLFLKFETRLYVKKKKNKNKKIETRDELLWVVIESHKVNFLHWILIELVSNYIVDSISSLAGW